MTDLETRMKALIRSNADVIRIQDERIKGLEARTDIISGDFIAPEGYNNLVFKVKDLEAKLSEVEKETADPNSSEAQNLLNSIYLRLTGCQNINENDLDRVIDIEETIKSVRLEVLKLAEIMGFILDQYIPIFNKKEPKPDIILSNKGLQREIKEAIGDLDKPKPEPNQKIVSPEAYNEFIKPQEIYKCAKCGCNTSQIDKFCIVCKEEPKPCELNDCETCLMECEERKEPTNPEARKSEWDRYYEGGEPPSEPLDDTYTIKEFTEKEWIEYKERYIKRSEVIEKLQSLLDASNIKQTTFGTGHLLIKKGLKELIDSLHPKEQDKQEQKEAEK